MKKEGLSKKERLRKAKEFERVFKEGKKIWVDKLVLIIYAPNDLGLRRLGIIVSKKVGKAVKRNKLKRWIREVFRRNKEWFPESSDIIIIPHPSLLEKSYHELLEGIKKKLLSSRKGQNFYDKKTYC
ncbi:MAG: ribonuclease P protein component [Thermodesulfobacteria bacterium]|nr:ribonuclease P protein component [Thermodesulfobacteriota bacterium]